MGIIDQTDSFDHGKNSIFALAGGIQANGIETPDAGFEMEL